MRAVSEPVTWEASATYITSFVSAAKSLGHLTAVLPRLDGPTRAMVEAPGRQAWWPGQYLLTLLVELESTAGAEAVKETSIRGSRERMGPLVRPLASVILSLTRTPMEALLNRLATFVSAGIKGIDARFVAHQGKPGGMAIFTFPQPVPAVMGVAWYGLFDVGFTLARKGALGSVQIDPTVHRFEVTW